MEIKVKNIEFFENFISSIIKLGVPACKFEINKDGCEVSALNDSTVMRAFYSTNAISSDKDVSFCFTKLSSLLSSLGLVEEFDLAKTKQKDFIMDYDGTFIKYSGVSKFKFSTVREDVIERSISPKLSAVITPVFGCTLSNVLMKKINSLSFVSASAETKVYFYKDKDLIFAEIDDKQSKMSDSATIPVTNDLFGDWNLPLVTKLDSFRLWNLLQCESIKFSFTDKNVLEIINESNDKDGNFIKIRIITSLLKG
jgi:hypothetical protein